MSVKHVIFDCDGVLVDSEPLSMRADVMVLQRFGIEMGEDEAHALFVGKTFEAMLEMMTERHGTQFPPGLHDEKGRIIEEMYVRELEIVAGVREVLAAIKARGLSMSIASNSPRRRVELALKLTGISDYFDRIVTFEDVAEGKPAPDVYLAAAQRAGVSPADCLAVEDSATGSTAALAAGLRTIGFVGTHADAESQAETLQKLGVTAILREMAHLGDFL